MSDHESLGRTLHRLLLAKGVLRSRGQWFGRRAKTRAAYEEVAAAIRALPSADGRNPEDQARLRDRIARLEAEVERLKAQVEKRGGGT